MVSGLDLSAVSRAVADVEVMKHPTLGVPVFLSHEQAERVITAAAPLIEAQVRERVAQEIEAAIPDVGQGAAARYREVGLLDAARIARGGAS